MTSVIRKSLLFSRRSYLAHFCYSPIPKIHSEINFIETEKRYRHSRFAKCWKCGIERENVHELFCQNCKIIQNPDEKNNYFKLLHCDESFDIDLQALKNKYRQMQSVLHPDKFSKSTDEEKHISEDFSVLVNKAYIILKEPLKRAAHLLMLKGEQLREDENIGDIEFLTEIMSLNEEVQNATTKEKLKSLNISNNERITELEKQISGAFKQNNLVMVKSSIIKLKYYNSLSAHINKLLEEKDNHY